ncbi:MAG TPA: hypothetical protein DCZ30_04890 [Clostridiales bacterium]|nr:hypothetical protein [Clostridiales bacterium]
MKIKKENLELENDVEYWKKKYKKLNTKFLVAMVIMLVLMTSILGMYAYAKYITSVYGGTSAYVAQWSVKVTMGNNGVDGEFTDGTTINMASTKVSNENVQTGKIAPGDKGQIILNIDARDCETAVAYVVTMNPSNLPTNMNFYSDAGYTVPITTENGIITIRGTMSLEERASIQPVVIYWDWPFSTGTTTEEKDANDLVDTTFMGQTLTANISATVSQVNGYGSGETLASIGSIGEYVNYDATSGSGAGRSITPSSSLTGSSTTTTFYSSDVTKWRIYSKNAETGEVTLIAADPTSKTLTLSNKTGWKNAVNVLNSIGDIYGHGNGATGGRSIQETDISSHSTYNPENYKNNQHQTNGTADNLGYYYYTGNSNRYETETYTSGTFIMDDNSEVTATAESPVTMRQTYYGYTGSSYIANPYYNLIFRQSTNSSAWKPNFWVAARYVYLRPSYCSFRVRVVSSGNVSNDGLYHSAGNVGRPSYAVVPMVTLQSNIQVSGMDANGVWLLDI